MTLDELIATLELAVERKTFERAKFFVPVPKQQEFFEAGAKYTERMLMAGNGNGKTECAAFEVACHLTGEYPPWWKGYRFAKPVRVWAAGTSVTMLREGGQTKLCGPAGVEDAFGTGMIPRDRFVDKPSVSRTAADAYESFQVRHVSGGISRLVFKTYVQERQHWQGADIDLIWFDEEPPEDRYTEGLARLRGRGISMMTFTPLKGMSEVVCRFLEQPDPQRCVIHMGIMDATWYSQEERERQINLFPLRERRARAYGEPLMGEGKVWPTPDEDLRIPAIPLDRVPEHWAKIWGIDFGINHPFGAALCAWDRDMDVFYVLHTIRMSDALPLQHATAMRAIAPNVPVAWPHDGHNREKSSGVELAEIYRRGRWGTSVGGMPGLNMLREHATSPDGGTSLYASVTEIDTLMQAGRWKVCENCHEWFQENSTYHYKNGQIVPLRDDVLSAARYAYMMRRFARAIPLGNRFAGRPRVRIAKGVEDFPYF